MSCRNRVEAKTYRDRFCFFTGSGNVQGALEGTVSRAQRSTDVSADDSPRMREYVFSVENTVQSPSPDGLTMVRTRLH